MPASARFRPLRRAEAGHGVRGLGGRRAPPWVTSASASDVLALPRQVEGRPLVRIGVKGLPFAPASVVVPDTVRIIERDNACRGTKRLILPEGLVSIGAHCFWSRKLEARARSGERALHRREGQLRVTRCAACRIV